MTAMAVMIGLLLGVAGMMNGYAQSFTVGDLNYAINDDGISVTVTGHVNGTSATGSLVIPASVTYLGNSYVVTKIGSSAFYDCADLTGNLTIPNSVTSIGSFAFFGSGLTGSLTIPNSVITIDEAAFSGCGGFTGNLTLPNALTSIGENAFSCCYGLAGELIIPNSVITIGNGAFSYCTDFSSLVIPNSVTSIGSNIVYTCDLEQIVVSDGNPVYDSRDNCNAIIQTSSNELIVGCKNTTIPNSVSSIGSWAFASCSGLTTISFPNSVTSIGGYAFTGCKNLSGELIIPNSVTSIGGHAFSLCTGLTGSLTIPESLISIEGGTFLGCTGFTGALVIPNSVETIGSGAFQSCSSITELTIGEGVTSIGSSAFKFCSSLSTVHFNAINCTLMGTTYPYDNGESAVFYSNNSHLTPTEFVTLTIGENVQRIPMFAFYGCSGITSVEIPESVIRIDDYSFKNCNNLISVTMFSSVPQLLYDDAFVSTSEDFAIYVPYTSLNTYKTADGWSSYADRIYPWLQKNISGYGSGNDKWAFIASPLTTQNLMPTSTGIENMITETTYDLYRFNQSAELEWQNYKAHTNDFTIANGQGYLYANQEDVNLIFKGTFNEGTSQAVGLTYDGTAQFAGWNLVGNPFPYAATVSRSYYVMNEDGTAIEPTPLSAGNTIAACTGIMVKADGANESVTFSKATRQNAVNNGLLHIVVANEDKAIVSFNEDDELAKYVFNKDKAQIYIPQGTEEYAIAFSDKQRTMPLNFKAVKDGEYTLSINPQNAELDYLHLIDNLTGNDIDLLQTPDYTFSAKKTDYASRFRLVFSACGDADGDNDAPFAFVSNGEIILVGTVGDAGTASLQIVDVMGRVCRDAMIASPNHHVSTNGIASGVYVLRLINGDDVKTQKIVID